MENTRPLKYMPQLDSVRTIAVLLVITWHWLPSDGWFNLLIPGGGSGVTLFFVLSAFLITKILLEYKHRPNASRLQILKGFYGRRFLRIFPIYYLTLLVCLIGGTNALFEKWGWYFSYTQNFYMFFEQKWDSVFAPFWTLAVEEQFYIIWPFLILGIATRWLPFCLVPIIAIGPFFRIWVQGIGYADHASVLVPAQLDAFGIGAALAFWQFYQPDKPLARYSAVKWGALVALLLYLWKWWAYTLPDIVYLPFEIPFPQVLLCLSCVYLVAGASVGFQGIGKVFLENRMVLYMGKISYAMYLWHMLVPSWFYLHWSPSKYVNFCVHLPILFLMAHFSWKLIEAPLNRQKWRFPYRIL